MKLQEVIDKISKVYREEAEHVKSLYNEYIQVSKELLNAQHTNGENIKLSEYRYLQNRKEYLKQEIDQQKAYCDGIAYVREQLFEMMEGKQNE